MISTRNIQFSYGKGTEFNFPDITAQRGETLLITGGSGKGKTTLLHLLGGLLKPQSGEIRIEDTNLPTLSDKKLDRFRGQNIGLVLQQSYFVESLSVEENVVLASWLATGRQAVQKARQLLEQLGLKDQMHKLPSQLSIGQQQRASIARALINEPKLLLADEPTSSLDDENAFIVADMLSGLAKQYGTALVIVTHDQRLKDRFSNQITLS
ncbi:ATP-binding cassette domain-containing protein [Flavobacterium salilacus subsp. salilacus]|uniref:ABC transporter ATP-binding protein n=1 Tax=Flavobacterium TaxID=237 RepID=UPI00107500B3|nr:MULTISPECIES: ATP-binding cassette domain-containing protein [Flavobacterium]KAF2519845.1 ATP-binding cassette domain-containing protein [Flavobacterium salilacus subsp. salilacus]MBE1614256.1 ATP-binding cassette domain-containing protein [Flavobacterium sp. SaA2.13]